MDLRMILSHIAWSFEYWLAFCLIVCAVLAFTLKRNPIRVVLSLSAAFSKAF